MKRMFLTLLLLLIPLTPAHAAFRLEGMNEKEEVRLPTQEELAAMHRTNPDFTTYPNARGIVWLKRDVFARTGEGGVERTQLWVILGRQGIDPQWLTWNIPLPEGGGTVELLGASVHAADTGDRLLDVRPRRENGLCTVAFPQGARVNRLPETFILVIAWRETAADQLTFGGASWFQETLPVWEAAVEARLPSAQPGTDGQTLAYQAFPQNARPEVQREGPETVYTWRRINLAPFNPMGLDATTRAGLVFSTHEGETGLVRLMRDAEAASTSDSLPPAPNEALLSFKKSPEEGMRGLLTWLQGQPELAVAEGGLTARAVPDAAPWTREEKVALARAWLGKRGIDALLRWRLPLDPAPDLPVCSGLLQGPVLELPVLKGSRKTGDSFFYDMRGTPSETPDPLLQGARVVGLSGGGRLVRMKVPGSKAADNRMSAIMDLKLDPQGMLSGRVRVLLRGGWTPLIVTPSGNYDPDRMVAELFPGLQNYDSAQIRKASGGALELSFTLNGKPGIGGSGQGLLAALPDFEPRLFLALEDAAGTPLELRFPFILEQSVTVGLPAGADRALVSGSVARTQDKINYAESYKNKRHRLEAEARCTVGIASVGSGERGQLRRAMELWRAFSTRPIPVQVRSR